jgi:hypothetical protein
MKSNGSQIAIGQVIKAPNGGYIGTRRRIKGVAARLRRTCRFVACSLFLILAGPVNSFAETANTAQVNMDVINERLSDLPYLMCSMLMGLLLLNSVIATWVWLVGPRTTKRQRVVAVGLGIFGSLAMVLSKAGSQMPSSSGDLVFEAVAIFLLFFFPVSAWLVSLCMVIQRRSSRSGIYLAVSGLLFFAVFGWRVAAVHFYDDTNPAEYSDEQPGVEAHGSAGSVEGAH